MLGILDFIKEGVRVAGEKLFENKVKKYLHSMGVYAAGTPEDKMEVEETGWFLKTWGGGMQKTGIPDLLCCINGFFVSVELKASKGVASALQIKNTGMINRGKGIGVILYPEGFEEFKEMVRGLLKCKLHIPELNALKNANTSTKCDMTKK